MEITEKDLDELEVYARKFPRDEFDTDEWLGVIALARKGLKAETVAPDVSRREGVKCEPSGILCNNGLKPPLPSEGEWRDAHALAKALLYWASHKEASNSLAADLRDAAAFLMGATPTTSTEKEDVSTAGKRSDDDGNNDSGVVRNGDAVLAGADEPLTPSPIQGLVERLRIHGSPINLEAATEIERMDIGWKACRESLWAARAELAEQHDRLLKLDDMLTEELNALRAELEEWKNRCSRPEYEWEALRAENESLKGQIIDGIPKLASKQLAEQDAEIAKLRAENEDLKHDIVRHMDIANFHVNEEQSLRAALEKIENAAIVPDCEQSAWIWEVARSALAGEGPTFTTFREGTGDEK